MIRAIHLPGIVLVFALAGLAIPRQSQTSPATGQPAPPIITATTRLVQVSVIAKENGAPAAGLQATDFKVLVDGHPQKISFFSAESTGVSATPPAPLPPNTFTNVLTARGQTVTGTTIVLLDLVNTRLVDRMFARQQVIKYLAEIPPTDRIGVYVFGGHLRVLHDYTEDMSAFQKKLADAQDRLVSISKLETPDALDREQAQFDAAFMGRGGSLEEREFFTRNRVMGTLAVFKFIASHLERVPGRKNLIWVSGAFPMIFGYENAQEMAENYTDEVDATVRALSQANISVYPIDARGLTTPHAFDASARNPSRPPSAAPPPTAGRPLSNPAPRPNGGAGRREIAAHATMDEIAQRTGGHAYYNTNDLARAIHEAVADSALTYTIGFYPADTNGDREFHKIKIETSRHHVALHYRSGYLDAPPAPQTDTQRLLQLHDAAFSPLDATELGLTVHVAPSASSGAPAGGGRTVDLTTTIQPDRVILKQDGDRYSGRIDMAVIQLDQRGRMIEGSADTHDTIDLKLLADTYRKFTAEGLPVHKTVTLAPKAATLRIVARDAGSGLIGSISVPLDGI